MSASDDVTYRIATVDDVDALAGLRWDMDVERHPGIQCDRKTYFAAVRAAIAPEIARGAHIPFIAELGGETVACATLIWWTMTPVPRELHRARGYVSGVYTKPVFRRRGIARQLMENLMARAREMGMTRLILNASEMGRSLYLDLGFAPSPYEALQWDGK
jgi:GNAT superfamily N-acetyltransferase